MPSLPTPAHLRRVWDALDALPDPTEQRPWPILVSGCMMAWGCGIDGSSYGMERALDKLKGLDNICWVPVCPEHMAFGTPRRMPDLHDGDGHAAIEGRARFLFDDGQDGTEGILAASAQALELAKREGVVLALLTDMSAACGSQVISLGARDASPRRFQRGMGVMAATLDRAGIPVMSQRDHRTMQRLLSRLSPGFVVEPDALDHHEHPWTVGYFGG